MKASLAGFAAAFALLAVAHGQESEREPPDGTIGLLKLPLLLGDGPCDAFRPAPVKLFAKTHQSSYIGFAFVAQPWSFPDELSCEGLEVRVRLHSGTEESLPTLEYDYEAAAAIVLARHQAWCQVLLRSGSAWVHEECSAGFVSIETLLQTNRTMLYLRHGALKQAKLRPKGAKFEAPRSLVAAQLLSAELLGIKRIDGAVWLHLAVSNKSICDSDFELAETRRLWLPLRDSLGRITTWYFARGC
ncbi:hypothetical protein [Paucibacter sp. Y2R2-4]|uniref:hypothetical protein n=1 Tax=Paucibacter sp. Y2R2-4 TaxID=2893553 RepID=UPI0021E47019|nr:hypothetical protein [Paucibacter sp. Y2R2-4]MCV2350218.1 hypothetical protein [Paucibacter sp. Y2R2-4]